MRAVRGFRGRGADRGATVVHQIVHLEGGFTRRDRRCVGGVTRRDRRFVGVDVAFAFPENMSIYFNCRCANYNETCFNVYNVFNLSQVIITSALITHLFIFLCK